MSTNEFEVRAQRVGTLDNDLRALAGAIHYDLGSGARMVWVDDEKTVYVGHSNDAHAIPASWIVGTFKLGHSVGEIEEDLRAVAAERAKDSMMD